MWKTVIRRLLLLIPQLLILSILIFILAEHMPGDALTGMIDPKNKPERVEQLRQQYGFYDPWYVKYFKWVTNAVKGDFGTSFFHKVPVTRIIAERAMNTFWLGLLTVVLLYLLAIPLGILSGRFHDKLPDRLITLYSYLSMSMPSIIAGLMIILLFSFKLGWFPYGGTVDPQAYNQGGLQYILSRLHHMILPAATIALVSPTFIIQFLRSGIIDYEQADFVTTARSKGVPQKTIYSKHIFRNAVLPVASFTGANITSIITGAVFTETVFSYPGMGRLFVDSITQRDYTVANALIIFFAVLIVAGTLLSDIIMYIVDPRLKIN